MTEEDLNFDLSAKKKKKKKKTAFDPDGGEGAEVDAELTVTSFSPDNGYVLL